MSENGEAGGGGLPVVVLAPDTLSVRDHLDFAAATGRELTEALDGLSEIEEGRLDSSMMLAAAGAYWLFARRVRPELGFDEVLSAPAAVLFGLIRPPAASAPALTVVDPEDPTVGSAAAAGPAGDLGGPARPPLGAAAQRDHRADRRRFLAARR